jgi:hypothetical protein
MSSQGIPWRFSHVVMQLAGDSLPSHLLTETNRSSCKVPVIVRINQIGNVLTYCKKSSDIIFCRKYVQSVVKLLHADRHGKANRCNSSCECACRETTTYSLIDICGLQAYTSCDQEHTVEFSNTASLLDSFLISERQLSVRLVCEIVVVLPKTFPLMWVV